MKEFDLIALLTRDLPQNDRVVTGAGDDCAVLDLGIPNELVLFKTDAVVEGIHFTSETAPQLIGRKALARALSDIAAMGGKPVAALVTLALPKKFSADHVAKVYDGLNRCAAQFGVAIVGGETTTNPECILISISLLGTVGRGKQILRSGAQVGDAIFITGELGGSLSGRHLEFEPRLAEGRWLADHFKIHAMMDVSDGVAGDLRHILRAGGVGAELLKSAIPISRAAKLQARQNLKPPLIAALTDGEDFELLFTISSRSAVKLLDAWKLQFPKLRLSCIGKIVAGENDLWLRDTYGVQKLDSHGYNHFA
jgi:thiamine-monophosphate kinase